MARYKVLGSVAHNTAHSFASEMNYAGDDFVMGSLLTLARTTGEAIYYIDFVTGAHSPAFDERPFTHLVDSYSKLFWDNVQSQGSERALVSEARLIVRFDPSIPEPSGLETYEKGQYWCGVDLKDNRGIDHTRQLNGWWTPNPRRLKRPGLFKRLLGWIQRPRAGVGV